MKPSFAIVGCGKVATALGIFLSTKGYPVAGLSSRRLSSAEALARRIGGCTCSDQPREVTSRADIVFITTPDDDIKRTCDRISKLGGFKKDTVVLHCSGALPSTILSSARGCGAFIGSLHPLQSFAADIFETNPFENIIMAAEGDRKAVETTLAISEDLEAICNEINTEDKLLYHAAAVVASNYLVSLIDFSFKLLEKTGIAEKEAAAAIGPLIDGTLANIGKVGIPDALTGPIARGDISTVENHVRAIELKSPAHLALYKTLGLHTITVAKAKGALSPSTVQALEAVLAATGGSKPDGS